MTGWNTTSFTKVQSAAPCDVIHPDLKDPIDIFFTAREPRFGLRDQFRKWYLLPTSHPNNPFNSEIPCWISPSIRSNSSMISSGGRCSISSWTISLYRLRDRS